MIKALVLLLRTTLAVIFIYAGTIKASASQQFAVALAPFTFIPPEWTGVLAVALAWTELAAGILILLPKIHRLGAFLIIALCLLFIGVLGWALMNGIIVSCGCFGEDDSPSAGKMLLTMGRDVLILAGATAVIVLERINRFFTPLVRLAK
jgi:putative oxidoreductase